MNDVTVVMPVYNEEACINEVIDDWKAALDRLQITYNLLILNDGSRDNTARELARNDSPVVTIINKKIQDMAPLS